MAYVIRPLDIKVPEPPKTDTGDLVKAMEFFTKQVKETKLARVFNEANEQVRYLRENETNASHLRQQLQNIVSQTVGRAIEADPAMDFKTLNQFMEGVGPRQYKSIDELGVEAGLQGPESQEAKAYQSVLADNRQTRVAEINAAAKAANREATTEQQKQTAYNRGMQDLVRVANPAEAKPTSALGRLQITENKLNEVRGILERGRLNRMVTHELATAISSALMQGVPGEATIEGQQFSSLSNKIADTAGYIQNRVKDYEKNAKDPESYYNFVKQQLDALDTATSRMIRAAQTQGFRQRGHLAKLNPDDFQVKVQAAIPGESITSLDPKSGKMRFQVDDDADAVTTLLKAASNPEAPPKERAEFVKELVSKYDAGDLEGVFSIYPKLYKQVKALKEKQGIK